MKSVIQRALAKTTQSGFQVATRGTQMQTLGSPAARSHRFADYQILSPIQPALKSDGLASIDPTPHPSAARAAFAPIQMVSGLPKKTKIKGQRRALLKKHIQKASKLRLMGKLHPKGSLAAIAAFKKKGYKFTLQDVKKFDRDFHKHKRQDELISTATTLHHGNSLQQTDPEIAQEFVALSDKIRFPTEFTGHNVGSSQFQHPTSKKTETYASSGTAHGTFDSKRAEYVMGAKDPIEALDRSLEFTFSHVQPPFTKSSKVKHASKAEAIKAHNLREDLKAMHSKPSGKKEVAADAPWKPAKPGTHRSVSPPRKRLKESGK